MIILVRLNSPVLLNSYKYYLIFEIGKQIASDQQARCVPLFLVLKRGGNKFEKADTHCRR
jgi:hypothetical protein